MPSRPFIELTNIGSAGMVAPLAVPGTWSPTFVQANRVLLDGGDIPVAPAVTFHTIEVMGPKYIRYGFSASAMKYMKPCVRPRLYLT